ncbi:dihydrofolate reductase family protein [Spirosoma sp. KNUC1025]|uniref:dihydrofolate reductase family protein n=1 Tax=Spirosoma sp. KNUC1025 TaxID=2894082 RepID=UPI00386D563F|nr:dihydrofolate reductase family protein [Spirosoma sp. KNUC1025]
MRKLKLQVQITIDGFIAGPNGEMDWLSMNWGEDIMNFVGSITEPIDTILLGRKLAEGFIPAWQSRAESTEEVPGAQKMNDTPKVVFSKTLESIDGKNATVNNGDLAAEVNALKNEEGGDLIAYGGGEFVSSLIQNNLIDDYYLFVNPVAIGKGMSIFGALSNKLNLKLVETKAFESGIALLHYQSA